MVEQIRVADYIANRIFDLGVREVFTITGGGAMFLNDGVACHPGLRAICSHHEQASAMGAVAYAKYKNDLAVVMTTTGCGSTNTITGLLDAWQDSVPCLFVSGQANLDQTAHSSGLPLRQVGVQEASIVEIVKPITKHAVMVTEPTSIRRHFDEAVHLARTGRPGPVWLDVPLDVQGAYVDPLALEGWSGAEEAEPSPEGVTAKDVSDLRELFATAERPIVLAGNGIRLGNAMSEFKEFIERYQLPFAVTYLGVDLLPSDHPLNIGRIGVKGDRAGNFAVQNADLVLSIGTRLAIPAVGYRKETFAREAKVVAVDIDPTEHAKPSGRVDLFIHSDAKSFLKDVQVGNSRREVWLETCQGWRDAWPVCLKEYENEPEGVNIYCFVEQLSKVAPADATIITDAGSAYYALSQGLKVRTDQRYIIPAAQAELGFTIPASIGAAIANGNRCTIGVTGDGSFNTNIQELQTIVHHNLNVKLFVLNNDGYLSNRAAQDRYFDSRYIGIDKDHGISFPSFEKIAAAYGLRYSKAADIGALGDTLASVIARPGPEICEIICPKSQEIVPTLGAFKAPDGTITARPAEDMYPFLSREEFLSKMIVAPLPVSIE